MAFLILIKVTSVLLPDQSEPKQLGSKFCFELTENLSHIVSPTCLVFFSQVSIFLIRQRMRRDRWQPSDRRLGNRGSAENRIFGLRRSFGFGSLRRLRTTSRQKKSWREEKEGFARDDDDPSFSGWIHQPRCSDEKLAN